MIHTDNQLQAGQFNNWRPTSDEYQGKSHQVDSRRAAVVDIPAGQLDLALSQQSPSRSISFAAMMPFVRAKGRRGG